MQSSKKLGLGVIARRTFTPKCGRRRARGGHKSQRDDDGDQPHATQCRQEGSWRRVEKLQN
jgi:hypothetical protein